MSKKLKSLFAMLAFLFVAACPSMAQVSGPVRFTQERERVPAAGNVPTLGCCRCLGGSNSLDLSTIASNNWTVNGNPVAFLTAIHPAWDFSPGTAQWVSTVATGGTGSVAPGLYDYKLKFVVPNCAIEQRVTISGRFGGDDDVLSLALENIGTSAVIPLGSCSGGWCFNTANNSNPRTFSSINVPPGAYYLRMKIQNSGGPSGMFVNAKLTSTCRN